MRISKKAEYALRALFVFARGPQGRLHQIQELSNVENIPVKFLEQILLTLKNHGILNSKRGVGGGYTLRRAANSITISEVIQLIDGPLAPVACAAERPTESCTCPDPNHCALRVVMRDARQRVAEVFDSVTLDAALQQARGSGGLAFEI